MNPTKDEIKAWLKTQGHTRQWLGKQCGGLQKRAVDNWLSSPREIPEGTMALIRRLMAEDAERAKHKADPVSHLILTVPISEFRAWEEAALIADMTVTDYCVDAIRSAYQADMEQLAAERASGKHLQSVAESHPKNKRNAK